MPHLNNFVGEVIIAEHFTNIMNQVNNLELTTFGFANGAGWNKNIGTDTSFGAAAISAWNEQLFISCQRPASYYPSGMYTGVKVLNLDGIEVGEFLTGRAVEQLAWRNNDGGSAEATFRTPSHFSTTYNEWHTDAYGIEAPNSGYHFETRGRDGSLARRFGEHHLYDVGEAWDNRITQSFGGCWIEDKFYCLVQTLRKLVADPPLLSKNHYWIFVYDASGAFVEKYSLQNGLDTTGPYIYGYGIVNGTKSGYMHRVTVNGVVTREYPRLCTIDGSTATRGYRVWSIEGKTNAGYKTADVYDFAKPYSLSIMSVTWVPASPILVAYDEQSDGATQTNNAEMIAPFWGELYYDQNHDGTLDLQVRLSQAFIYRDMAGLAAASVRTHDGGVGFRLNGAYPNVVDVDSAAFPAVFDSVMVNGVLYVLASGRTDWSGSFLGHTGIFLCKRERAALTDWYGYTESTKTLVGTFPSADSFRQYVDLRYLKPWRIPRQHLTDIRAALIRLLDLAEADGADGPFMFFHPDYMNFPTRPSLWTHRLVWDTGDTTNHWYRLFATRTELVLVGETRYHFMSYWPITDEQIAETPELVEDWAKDDDELRPTRCADMDIGEVAQLAEYMEKSSKVYGQ